MESESKLNYYNVSMLLLKDQGIPDETINFFNTSFAGVCYHNLEYFTESIDKSKVIYLLGDIEVNYKIVENFFDKVNKVTKVIYVVKDYSNNYLENTDKYIVISKDQVPTRVYDQGVFIRDFFAKDKNYFDLLTSQHKFQELTESNKEGISYRSGIYLSNVEKKGEDYHFNLLRCSTNLKGPTDNFRETDIEIINKVNKTAETYFENGAELNHVLAQVYQNSIVDGDEKKAKIKQHSDKTKDMPRNGLMAFCTFYKKNETSDVFEDNSLTILRFRKKKCVADASLQDKFDICLYPNSIFMMSLSTNRYYTHEIVPSRLSIEKLPVRLGYVIRCSKTKAIHRNGETFIVGERDNDDNNTLIKLEKPTEKDITDLRHIYYTENFSDQLIDYGDIYFSMNDGDYTQPLL